MTSPECDIIILGAGMVGLTLALQCAQGGLSVRVIDCQTPKTEWPKDSLDLRTVALNPGAAHCLQRIGAWSQLKRTDVGMMQHMRVWDAVGGGEIDFDAADNQQEALSFVVENRVLVRALWQRAEQHERIHLHTPWQSQCVDINEQGVTLYGDDDTHYRADCIIGADGRFSWLKQQLQINTKTRDYDHHAVVSIIRSEQPHNNTAYQAFLANGPVGLLPLADPHLLSVVWSTTHSHAEHLQQLSEQRFGMELSNALSLKLGLCQSITPRACIPLTARLAERWVQPRAALIGDAAHTIHPLAGQGVNLGIADSKSLAQALIHTKAQHKDCGSLRALRAYERERHAPTVNMLQLMRLFKELFTDQSAWLVQSRNLGLNTANRLGFLKRCFINYASGTE